MDLDFKTIGLAAKDIILGVGAAAAGASGGPAAAEGVGKAGSGLDRILGMAGVSESRGDKFDRADFAARPQAQAGASPPAAQKPAETPPSATLPTAPAPPNSPAKIAAGEPTPMAARNEGPYTGDTKLAVDHLRSLGWSHEKVQQILSGPENTSLAAVVGKDTKGFRARGADGTALTQVDGTALSNAKGRAVATVDGQAVPMVRGVRVKDDNSSGSA